MKCKVSSANITEWDQSSHSPQEVCHTSEMLEDDTNDLI